MESIIHDRQQEYYAATNASNGTGESTVFIEFMLSQIDKILDELSVQISDDYQQIPESVQKLLAVMEYDISYTGNALMEKLGLKSREGFRRNYLRPAMEMHLIHMTIPDKPNSRNQRYIKD